MKKILLTTGILIASTFIASAEMQLDTQVEHQGRVRDAMKREALQVTMATGTMAAMAGVVTTGDPAVDAQLKALTLDMEAKIKAIRDQYEVQIKALIGTKKLMMASTTRPMMGVTRPMMRDDHANGENGDENRSARGAEMMASTTPENGEDRGAPLLQGGNVSGRIQNFFRGIFGR